MAERMKQPAYNPHQQCWIVEEIHGGLEHRFDTQLEAVEFYDVWR